MGLAASLFAAFVVISSSFPWYADFVRESFISVHQYAQEINNPDVIGQFLRHHLLFSASLFSPCCRCLPLRCSLAGAWRLAVSAEKNSPGFQQNQSVKSIGRLFFQ
ncbi:lateral flagellar export/assembly protein (FlhB-like) [Escherichia coli]|uniref:Lateral flagellar export/assembly protein (FlhB-like) n=1 Tax=Escherichia coli TaxID=562 RepID=A0A377DG52_ECOLX|nr:lateral flagellar export/assembly protein (FlhB-like) [Escherichia coli]